MLPNRGWSRAFAGNTLWVRGKVPRGVSAWIVWVFALLVVVAFPPDAIPAPGENGVCSAKGPELPWIVLSPDGRGFIEEETGKPFVPWGFNYDHDEAGRLIEDYWHTEWRKVEENFREMRTLGANVVRIHLQLGRFMETPEKARPQELERLRELLRLAQAEKLYLNITGLGCYHRQDVPPWYDRLSEVDRWKVQVRFWEAVSQVCASEPVVFCYDLMNEPVAPGGDTPRTDWLGPAFAGKHFVQFIALDRAGRAREEIARQWIRTLVQGIRQVDRKHLVTVGLVPWSLDRPGLTSGFVPQAVAPDLDFISVHIYPEQGKLEEALATLAGFAVGKPVVVEEIFPLRCSIRELEQFLDRSTKWACGWIGFYWGKTPEECRVSPTIADQVTYQWLMLFQKGPPAAR
jgi:hypothetical protein